MRNRGFIRLILLIIVGLVLLGYFGVNVREVLASPVVRDNLLYAWNLAKEIWGNYLAGPAMWVWEHVLRFFWELFLEGLDNLRNGNGPSSLIPSN